MNNHSLRPLAACHVLEHQRDNWIRAFLPRHEPFFLRGEQQVDRLLQAGMIVYTRSEFHESFPEFFLDYGCTYRLWDVPQDTYVWMAETTRSAQVEADFWQDMLLSQVHLQRGQVYDDAWFLRLQNERAVYDLMDGGWQDILRPCQVNDLSHHVILTHGIWTSLPREVQAIWLLEWLNDQLVEDEVVPVNPSDIPLPASHQPLIMKYSGCFADVSGANCFAATLAMATGTLVLAEQIIDLWLHQEPFLRALHAQGYHAVLRYTGRTRSA